MGTPGNYGNQNAVGNINTGAGAPKGTKGKELWGFFSKVFPENDEIQDIVMEIAEKNSITMLWENIIIQYTAILRAQRIMWVKSKDELTKIENGAGYLIQTAADKQANFMCAQSSAMATLTKMLSKYEEFVRYARSDEEQFLRIEKLKTEINKLKMNSDGATNDSNERIALLAELLNAPRANRKIEDFEKD